MISRQFGLRRRVFVKRVASICGLGLLVSVSGCSSQGLSLSDNGAERYGTGATGSVPIPPEPVYGYADTPSAGPVSGAGGYHEASVQHALLAPVRTASGSAEPGSYVGGSYAMQPVEDHGGANSSYPPGAGAAPGKRYAESAYSNGSSYGYKPRYDSYKPPYRDEGHGSRPLPYDHAGSSGDDYIVVQGDTLFGIAQRFGISAAQLAELNGLTGSTIYVGQHLRVSGSPKYTATNRYRDGTPYDEGRSDHHDYDQRQADHRDYDHRQADHHDYDQRHADHRDYELADDRKAPPPGYSSYRDYRPAPRYGYGQQQSYAEPHQYDRHEDDRNASARQSYGDPRPYHEQSRDRYASRHDDSRSDDREDSYSQSHRHPKGSYSSYSVQPGETLFDIARRNGLSHRQLAEFNDIPLTARLYPGQVLHIPRANGYDRDGRGHDADGHDGGPDRRGYRPDGYSRGTPFSQNAPAEKNGANSRERRVAKADIREDRNGKTMNDAGSAAEAETTGGDRTQSRPILAEHRDLGTPDRSGSETGAKECESLLASPAPRAAKNFREPVEGVIIGKFGSKEDGSFSDGIDFSVPKGTPVKAAENGVVAYAGNELPGFGNLILVRHADGFVTAYAHNDEMLVHRCEVVKRGQVISKAGTTGKVTKPELHFELRKDSKPIDPEGYFSRS